jgi:hypothetical protein
VKSSSEHAASAGRRHAALAIVPRPRRVHAGQNPSSPSSRPVGVFTAAVVAVAVVVVVVVVARVPSSSSSPSIAVVVAPARRASSSRVAASIVVVADATGRARRRRAMASRFDARARHIGAPIEASNPMFGTLGSLFASGPRLKYDLGREFACRAFGVWTHRRGTCQVRRTNATRREG